VNYDDDDDARPSVVVPPQPVMIPVKQFTAFTGDGDTIEIVGVHYHDEETNFVGIVEMQGEIFPQVIQYSVYKTND